MPRLNADSRQRDLGNLEAGMDARQVARAFGVHVSTIYWITDRFLQNNNVVDRPRSGRPRVTSQRQNRNIVRTHMRDRFLPATTTARQTVGTHNRPVSDTTVRRRLIAVHLNCRRPYIGQRITQRHRIARHNWAVLHRQWRNRQWQNIVFSDESRYCVDRADGRMRVWRRRGERFTNACVMERDSWGGPPVMLWGAISWGRRVQPVILENNGRGRGRGVTAQRYIDEVLTPVVVPVFAGQRQMVYQHDNARPHTALATQAFLAQHNITTMDWPALSPDLNPIEHLWDEIQRMINQRPAPVVTQQQLRQAAVDTYNNVPRAFIRNLFLSMDRCAAVMASNGGHTRY